MEISAVIEDLNPWWRDGTARSAKPYRFRRVVQGEILRRLDPRRDDRRAILLLGPRQVGKTILLRQLADDLLDRGLPPGNLAYFDFSDDRVGLGVSPRAIVDARPPGLSADLPRIFLLDEIHLAESWDRWLKQAVDQGVGRVVATDSAASLLRQGARESGQGRWDELRIEGLSFREFGSLQAPGEPWDRIVRRMPDLLDRYLAIGGFPEHALAEDQREAHRRLREDIVDRAIFRDLEPRGVDLPRVRDLFVYLVENSGGEWVASHRAADLRGAKHESVEGWLALLEDTRLVERLTPRATRVAQRLRGKRRPKIYAADPGLVTAFTPLSGADSLVRGRVFETAVFRHLREAVRELGAGVSYLQLGTKGEVDFVVDFVFEGSQTRIAIEVKSSPRVQREEVGKLIAAAAAIEAERRILIHGAPFEQEVEGVESLTLQRFLSDPIAVLEGRS